MSEFVRLAQYYFEERFYNCSEAIIRAANDYYDLKIADDDLLLFGAYGGGMFSGMTCGCLSAAVAIISRLTVKENAHKEKETLRPLVQKMVRNFKEYLGGTGCTELKPKYYSKEKACLKTVLLSAEIIEQTINEMNKQD